LIKAYQSVIDKYSLTNIDLDIEGDDLGDVPGEHKRFQAIKALKEKAKANGKELFVTLTLPATNVGLSDVARDEIKRAITDGAAIDLYKVM
jgi:chitinase